MATIPHVSGRLHLPAVRPRLHLGAWWREVVLIAILYVLYDGSRGLRAASPAAAQQHGRDLLSAERYLHLDVEHALNAGLGHVPVLAVLASYFYATLHFIVTPAVLIWLYRRHSGSYGQARNGIVIATLAGLVVFWLLPTAPPRLLEGGGFTDTMASVSSWGWWGGDGSAPRGLGGLTNELAAMPSLHVGWALWAGYWLFRSARHTWLRAAGLAYPVLTTLVVMSTANHYLLDAVAGALDVALATALVAGVLTWRRRARSGRPAPEPGSGTRSVAR